MGWTNTEHHSERSVNAISASDLTIGIGDQPLVKDIRFAHPMGRMLIVIGQNGVGKSTFLKTICGLIPPIQGEIKILGRRVQDMSMKVRAIQMAWLPQEESSEFGWKVEEYVALGRQVRSQSFFESREDLEVINRSIQKVDCESLRGRSILEMSGGERQRVRLARILAQESEVIVLDEPTTHLDVGHQLELNDLLSSLSEGEFPKTLILTLHDLNHAIRFDASFLLFHKDSATYYPGSAELLESNTLDEAFEVSFQRIPIFDEQKKRPGWVLIPGRDL